MDGLYHVAKVATGSAKITVFAHPSPIPAMMLDEIEAPPALRKKFVPIPSAIRREDDSGLAYTVVRGKQTHDVSLTP